MENGKERMNERVKSRDKRGKTSVVIRQDMMVFGWDGGRRNRETSTEDLCEIKSKDLFMVWI